MKTYDEMKQIHQKVILLDAIRISEDNTGFSAPLDLKIQEKLDKVLLYHIERGYETLDYLLQEKIVANRNRKRKLRSRIRNISLIIESFNMILSGKYGE